jgi:hypothetical protein
MALDFNKKLLQREFANNFHVPSSERFQTAEEGQSAGQGRTWQPSASQSHPNQFRGKGLCRQTVEGAVAGNAKDLW